MSIVQRFARVNRDIRVTVPLYNCSSITCLFVVLIYLIVLFVSTSFDSSYCYNVCMYRSCYMYVFNCGWVYFWINSWNSWDSYNSCMPVIADKFTHIPTSLTNEVKLSVTISHITHYNTCSALYRIGQYVYFSKLIADKCWFLNYLLPGGVVLIDQGFTIYDLSFHR